MGRCSHIEALWFANIANNLLWWAYVKAAWRMLWARIFCCCSKYVSPPPQSHCLTRMHSHLPIRRYQLACLCHGTTYCVLIPNTPFPFRSSPARVRACLRSCVRAVRGRVRARACAQGV